MAFVGGLGGVGSGCEKKAACEKKAVCEVVTASLLVQQEVSRRRMTTRMALDLISKPMRPNKPSEKNGGRSITDYSALTNIRPDVKEKEKKSNVGEQMDNDGEDGGSEEDDPNAPRFYTECARCDAVYEIKPRVSQTELETFPSRTPATTPSVALDFPE